MLVINLIFIIPLQVVEEEKKGGVSFANGFRVPALPQSGEEEATLAVAEEVNHGTPGNKLLLKS